MLSRWVREWMAGGKFSGGAMTHHLQSYMANRSKVPSHFSVLNELTIGLIPVRRQGTSAAGQHGSGYLARQDVREVVAGHCNVDTDTLPTYKHEYADGRVTS
jgi:hypothetical protein